MLRDEANKQQLDSLQRILTKGGVHSTFIKLAAAGLTFFLFVIAGRALSVGALSRYSASILGCHNAGIVGSIGQRLLCIEIRTGVRRTERQRHPSQLFPAGL